MQNKRSSLSPWFRLSPFICVFCNDQPATAASRARISQDSATPLLDRDGWHLDLEFNLFDAKQLKKLRSTAAQQMAPLSNQLILYNAEGVCKGRIRQDSVKAFQYGYEPALKALAEELITQF
ncbi:hypothetical protein ACQFN5_29995 (plasmid) [Klebsiella sp. WOUb02]|uniref:hypothetical protein n=1 Tax=Klebsiella sp. WOUb02 TaxID=3161071 RepID=UPI003CF6C548